MTLKSNKVARPPIKPPDPDPAGFAQVLAEISVQLEEAYRLRAFLRKFLLVEFEPAELQRIIDAGTAQEWPPVTLPATLTIYRCDA
jgi:hypothetical protein